MRVRLDEATIFRRAYSLIALHVAFELVATAFRDGSFLVANIAGGIGLLCALFACHYYVRAKELPRRYVLLGLFGFVGFWILLCWSEIPKREDARTASAGHPH